MKIILVCNQGVSTGIVARKMKEAAQEQNIDLEIIAISDSDAESQDLKADIVLLGPQIRYLKKKLQALTEVPVSVIDMRDYGMMNGKKIFLDTLNLIKENKQ